MKILALLLLICMTVGIANAKRYRNHLRTQPKPIIGNNGKIVNNGIPRDSERLQMRNQNLLDQLGYTLSVDELETTNMETLLKQKFLLEILFNVNGALISEELQELGETLVIDELRYVGGLDTEMLQLLELCINNEILTKEGKFNALNAAHVQQMLGLYKLLVRAKDWKTFQRNACFARMHFNGELLVNALLLAVGERDDTVDLIIPGIDEILPELYYDKQLLDRARAININNLIGDKANMKPQFLDIIKPYSGRNRMQTQKNWQLWRQGIAKQTYGGIPNQRWNSMQPQKTWQQWRQERLEKLANLQKVKQLEGEDLAKLVMPVSHLSNADSRDLDERISYLTRDVGLNNFWYSFNVDSLRKMYLQIPAVKETTEGKNDELLRPIENNNAKISKSLPDIANANRRRLSEEKRVAENLLESGDVKETTKAKNDEQLRPIENNNAKISKTLPDIANTNRLLYINRRRLSEEKRVAENVLERDEVSSKEENVKEEVRKAADIKLKEEEIIMNKEPTKAPIDRFSVEDHAREKDSSDSTSRLLKVNRRRMSILPSSSQKDSDNSDKYVVPKDLQQTSVNIDRLLRIDRRRFNQEPNGIQNEERKLSTTQSTEDSRFKNELKNTKNTLDQLPDQSINERIQTTIDDVGIQNELEQTSKRSGRLLRINRRRLIQNVSENTPIRVNQNVEKQLEQVEGNTKPFKETSVENERLLKVNRRRKTEILTKNKDERLEQPNSLLGTMGKLYKNMSQTKQANRVASSEELLEENESDSSAEDDTKKQRYSTSSEEELFDDKSQTAVGINSLRSRRSIANGQAPKIRNFDLKEQRAGEIMLTTMQQILVRMKMERLTNILESKTKLLNGNVVSLSRQKILNLLNETKGIEQIIDFIVKTELKATKNVNFMEEVGEILMGRQNIIGQDMLQFLARIVESAKLESDFTKQLSGPFSLIMERVISLIDAHTNALDGYNNADLILDSVKLHDVKIDRLLTYFDKTDTALINLVLENKEVDLKSLNIVPVARQERLNHKPFTLTFDITNESRAPRPVVIRIFLGPKLDDAGRAISFQENRRNFLLLDAFTTKLPMGRTTIKRKSTDITWTSNDSTSYMQIYKQVMLAIDGRLNLQLKKLLTGNCNFPHRLLLPRGLAKGLPMQLFVIVTPVTDEDAKLQREMETIDSGICGMGTAAIKLDKLPLGFPLDRSINDSKYLLERNAILKDVSIYHQADIAVKDIKS